MDNLKIPVWLIAACVFVFMGVVLEQLYIGKRPVDLWGLKLNQPINTESEADGLEILASEKSSNNSGVFQDTVRTKSRALLLFQAFGDASRNSDNTANAGIRVKTKVNGQDCGANQSFEGSTNTVQFFSGVTCIKILEPASYHLEAERVDHKGINNPGQFQASYVLLKVGSKKIETN